EGKRGDSQGAGRRGASGGGEAWGGKESRAALAEKMVERADRDAGPGGSIGDDHIHPMERQFGDEVLNRLVCAADDLNCVVQPECRVQKPPDQRWGEDVGDADDQPQRFSARTSLESIDEFASQ